jgi:hypothetical protein
MVFAVVGTPVESSYILKKKRKRKMQKLLITCYLLKNRRGIGRKEKRKNKRIDERGEDTKRKRESRGEERKEMSTGTSSPVF